jgi:phenylacetate-CoA ligase
MLNWRKPLIGLALNLTGRPVFKCFRYLKSIEYETSERLRQLQDEKLEKLLLHAYSNVPYYGRILPETGVIKNGRVFLENFGNIPVLTKDIIRREGENLYSKDHKQRHSYKNSSGGSTGEPIEFRQDRQYQAWGLAARFLYNLWADKDVGQPEIKLWGSERDIFEGSEKISTRLRRYGFNVLLLNSFAMSNTVMARYVKLWNNFRPRMVWAYTSSIYEFGLFVRKSGVQIYSPTSIICTAETLTEDVRRITEDIFKCPVLNQYGSREVGVIAAECLEKHGLHALTLNNKVEILDDSIRACSLGQMGGIYITTLQNYSMPLIRYEIGDTAVVAEKQICGCGRNWPLIGSVTGRISDHFRTKDGQMVHGEYFTHLLYHKKNIEKFKFIQHAYDDVEVMIQTGGNIEADIYKDIEAKVKFVLGDDCKVRFNTVKQIPTTPSGKYIYTVSEITE